MSTFAALFSSSLSRLAFNRRYIFWLYLLGGMLVAVAAGVLDVYGVSYRTSILILGILILPAHFFISWFLTSNWLSAPRLNRKVTFTLKLTAITVISLTLMALMLNQVPLVREFTVRVDAPPRLTDVPHLLPLEEKAIIELHELAHVYNWDNAPRDVSVIGGELQLNWRVSGAASECQVLVAIRPQHEQSWRIIPASEARDGSWNVTVNQIYRLSHAFELVGIATRKEKEAELNRFDPFKDVCTVSQTVTLERK